MIKRLVVVDVERRRLFVVERAAALEFAARLLELDRFRDQRGQQRAGPKLVEEGSRETHDAAIITICRLRGETAMRRAPGKGQGALRSEEHTSELQSLMRSSYAVFCLKQKKKK